MSKKKRYEPTEREREDIYRDGMMAAWRTLGRIENKEKDMELSEGVSICLQAFKSAREAVRNAEENLLSHHPGNDWVATYENLEDVVLSALYCHVSGMDPSKCSPFCVGGFSILCMCRAAIALTSLDRFHDSFDDDIDWLYGVNFSEKAFELCVTKIKTEQERRLGDEPTTPN